MGKETISFSARFNGVEESLVIFYSEISGIFSKESQEGLFFDALPFDEEVQRGAGVKKEYEDTASLSTTTSLNLTKNLI